MAPKGLCFSLDRNLLKDPGYVSRRVSASLRVADPTYSVLVSGRSPDRAFSGLSSNSEFFDKNTQMVSVLPWSLTVSPFVM